MVLLNLSAQRWVGLAAWLVTASVWGQTSETPEVGTLPEIVTTATRSALPIEEVLSDVTVLDEQAIEKSGTNSLADLLARQPGVELSRMGGAGTQTSLFLRGTNSNHVLVLIDGVRTASASTGASSLQAIPLANIERIEILRGAASSLYGADAVGGVINIISKRPAGDKPLALSGEAGCGNHHTCRRNLAASGGVGMLRWSAGVGAESSHGFSALDNPVDAYGSYAPDRDGYRNNHFFGRLELTPVNGQTLALAYQRNKLNADYDNGPRVPAVDETVLSTATLSGTHQITDRWKSKWLLAEMHNDYQSRDGWGDSSLKTRGRQVQWQNEWLLDQGGLFNGEALLILEHNEEKLTSTTTAFQRDRRDTNAVVAGYRWRYADHSAQVSWRNDHTDQYGDELTWGLNYGYALTPALTLTAGVGSAFKAPTFMDLYGSWGANPDLDPEKARMVELGVRYAVHLSDATGSVRLTGWQQRIRNMISWNSAASRSENIARADLRGMTLGLDGTWHGFDLTAALDWQMPENPETDKLLPRRSRLHGSVTLGKTFGTFYGSVIVAAAGKRYDDAANRVRLGGYSTVNLVAEWQVMKVPAALTVFAHVNNVFDKKYALAADYATGGVEGMVGVRGRW